MSGPDQPSATHRPFPLKGCGRTLSSRDLELSRPATIASLPVPSCEVVRKGPKAMRGKPIEHLVGLARPGRDRFRAFRRAGPGRELLKLPPHVLGQPLGRRAVGAGDLGGEEFRPQAVRIAPDGAAKTRARESEAAGLASGNVADGRRDHRGTSRDPRRRPSLSSTCATPPVNAAPVSDRGVEHYVGLRCPGRRELGARGPIIGLQRRCQSFDKLPSAAFAGDVRRYLPRSFRQSLSWSSARRCCRGGRRSPSWCLHHERATEPLRGGRRPGAGRS